MAVAPASEMAFDYQDSGTGEYGCGKARVKGGLYAVTKMGFGPGKPWWECLVDPPELLTPLMLSEMGISARDVSVRERLLPGGKVAHDLWDWVGAGDGPSGVGYWNVADHLEEGLNGCHGFSGRLPTRGIDWSLIQQEPGFGQSLRWLISPHAILTNADELWKQRVAPLHRHSTCVTRQERHDTPPHVPFCDSLWWESIVGGLPLTDDPADRRVIRTIGALSYPAYRPPQGFTPKYAAGIFMKLPFTLEIVLDPESKKHEDAAEWLERAHQPYKFSED